MPIKHQLKRLNVFTQKYIQLYSVGLFRTMAFKNKQEGWGKDTSLE